MYDAIVVGARCAGAATALLLARRGHRVLLLDRAAFPSDTISTLYIQPNGVASLQRWGLADAVAAAGTPQIRAWHWSAEQLELVGFPASPEPKLPGYAPRRLVLDQLLVNAARQAGVEVREEFAVRELLLGDGKVLGIVGRSKASSTSLRERGRIVIGADGRHSLVARAVNAPVYDEHAPLTSAFYAFFGDLPCRGLEQHARAEKGFTLIPTNGQQTLVAFVTAPTRYGDIKRDPMAACRELAAGVGALADRLAAARLESRFLSMTNLENYWRRPFGPGWALVGDAGHLRDPITGHGISDAFRDAELLSQALHECWMRGDEPAHALALYEQTRNELARPSFEWTLRVAELRPLGSRLAAALRTISDDPQLVGMFLGLNAGTVDPKHFFALPRVAAAMAKSS